MIKVCQVWLLCMDFGFIVRAEGERLNHSNTRKSLAHEWHTNFNYSHSISIINICINNCM